MCSVSLFTREWIEMCAECTQGDDGLVSLFTREWIEIIPFVVFFFHRLSPSLRGSGLKYRALQKAALWGWSPSLRGSGLKYRTLNDNLKTILVSLFTREWIEMLK